MRTRRILAAVAAAVAVSAVAWPVYGVRAFADSLVILAPLGVVGALGAQAVAERRLAARGLRQQLAAVAVLAGAVACIALGLFAWLMFVSRHDAFFMALASAYALLIGLGAARLVARRALADLDAVRAALSKVADGARVVQVQVPGEDELAMLAADVETMVGKLAAEERARQVLVASVSHDLRTPITSLRLIADALEDGIFEPDRAREQLRLLSTHVRSLSALIDDLFELSRLEAGDIRWSMEQVQLDELVHETIDAMRPRAAAESVAIHAELEERLSAARGNPEQLQRVLFNLIQNAIRHTPADGSVVVRARHAARGGAIEVEVADSGSGIDPSVRERIFEPFTQGPSRVAGENGAAGLGLAIARAIVTAHGGRIWLAEPGPGTRIRFSLPTA